MNFQDPIKEYKKGSGYYFLVFIKSIIVVFLFSQCTEANNLTNSQIKSFENYIDNLSLYLNSKSDEISYADMDLWIVYYKNAKYSIKNNKFKKSYLIEVVQFISDLSKKYKMKEIYNQSKEILNAYK